MTVKAIRIIEKFLFQFFLLSLFLIKLTPFYLFPIASKLFSSHTFAKLLIFAVCALLIILNKRASQIVKTNKLIFILVLFYFFSQSISVVKAEDIVLYWKAYHNSIFSIFIFLAAYLFIQEDVNVIKKTYNFILFTGVIVVSLEFLFFIANKTTLTFFTLILQKEAIDAYLSNIERGRYSLDLNIELFIPFFIYRLSQKNKEKTSKKQFIVFLSLLVLIFLGFLSNFRSRVLMIVFSLGTIFSLYLLNILKNKKILLRGVIKKITFYILMLLIPIYLALSISNNLNTFNVLDRFSIDENSPSYQTVKQRIDAAQKSMDLFYYSPLVGVGLGNYALYNNYKYKFDFYFVNKQYLRSYSESASSYPHNVIFQTLSESGLLGLIAYLSLLSFFIYKDYQYIKNYRFDLIYCYVISFWTIFIFMLFNPSSTIFTLGWFWFLRGLKESYQSKLYY